MYSKLISDDIKEKLQPEYINQILNDEYETNKKMIFDPIKSNDPEFIYHYVGMSWEVGDTDLEILTKWGNTPYEPDYHDMYMMRKMFSEEWNWLVGEYQNYDGGDQSLVRGDLVGVFTHSLLGLIHENKLTEEQFKNIWLNLEVRVDFFKKYLLSIEVITEEEYEEGGW